MEVRVIRFKQKKRRIHSPVLENRNSRAVDIRTTLATDIIVQDEDNYNEDPLSVSEWL